jgi:SAM-dependent methyltransferase
MMPDEYRRMFEQETTYWWFQGRKEIVMRLLLRHTQLGRRPMRALDVGCGTGLMLQEIGQYAPAYGLDVSPLATEFCSQRGIGGLTIGRVESMPYRGGRFDLILALDLLEHVSDDLALLRELWRVCKPGGHLLITVPAHQFLWSEHDEALHHKRRYSRRGLRRLISATGFETVRFSSAITFLLAPIAVFRLAQRLFKRNRAPKTQLIQLPRPVNWFLVGLLRAEARILEYADLPSGVSIVALLRKPERRLQTERVFVEDPGVLDEVRAAELAREAVVVAAVLES